MGIRKLLENLKEKGLKIGIISSNSKKNIEQYLKLKKMDVFDNICTSNKIFGKHVEIRKLLKKLDMKAGNVIYIGDEYRDIIACKNSSVRILAVTWGYDSLDLIKKGNPDFIANKPEEIYKIIDNIEIDKKSDLKDLEIVLISDLHLGYINNNRKLEKAVKKINQQSPDIVFIAGDLFDGNFLAVQSHDDAKELLNSIKTKYGTFLCWGNHDAGNSFGRMKQFIKSTDIILIEDNVINIENKFIIAGRKDSYPIDFQGEMRVSDFKELDKVNKELPIIVIDHQPSNLMEYVNKADLVLSGHTHKGQVFPFNLITKHLFIVDYGHYKSDSGLQSIVTSGLGTWGPPMRIGSDNEIAKIAVRFN